MGGILSSDKGFRLKKTYFEISECGYFDEVWTYHSSLTIGCGTAPKPGARGGDRVNIRE